MSGTADSCEVWVACVPPATDHLAAMLDQTERARRERLRHADDRDRFTAAAALLRLVAARFAGLDPEAVTIGRTCTHCGASHGRPRIVAHGAVPFDVSVSHSGRYAVVAACRGHRIGVDVEAIRSDYAEILPVACTPAEALRVHDARGFATTWVRKEAVLKATGEGLVTPPSDIEVSAPDDPPRVVRRAGHPATGWWLHDLAVDAEHVGAVAIAAPRPVRLELVAASDLLAPEPRLGQA